jgi:hypothetical protein
MMRTSRMGGGFRHLMGGGFRHLTLNDWFLSLQAAWSRDGLLVCQLRMLALLPQVQMVATSLPPPKKKKRFSLTRGGSASAEEPGGRCLWGLGSRFSPL